MDRKIKIAIDAMGGDQSPKKIIVVPKRIINIVH